MPRKTKKDETNDLLSEAQRRAAILLSEGNTGRFVADSLGIHESTLSEWRNTPEIKAAINALLKDAETAAANRLRQLATDALDTVEGVMNSKTASDKDRLAAALAILDRVNVRPPTTGSTSAREIIEQVADEQ